MVKLNLTYDDGKEFLVDLKEEDLTGFLDCLNKHTVYWDANIAKGFWTNLDKIRYIVFEDQKDPAENPQPAPEEEKAS